MIWVVVAATVLLFLLISWDPAPIRWVKEETTKEGWILTLALLSGFLLCLLIGVVLRYGG
jgi:hypothetical protein